MVKSNSERYADFVERKKAAGLLPKKVWVKKRNWSTVKMLTEAMAVKEIACDTCGAPSTKSIVSLYGDTIEFYCDDCGKI